MRTQEEIVNRLNDRPVCCVLECAEPSSTPTGLIGCGKMSIPVVSIISISDITATLTATNYMGAQD
jgi:hypothetical protein